MQAILTKYLPATNFKPSRIKAICARGSVIVSYDQGGSNDSAHLYAAQVLVDRFTREDAARYAADPKSNPWLRARAIGCLPTGDYAHVFISAEGGAK